MTTTTQPQTYPTTDAVKEAPGPGRWTWQRFTRIATLTLIGSTVLMMTLGRFVGPSLIVLDAVLLVGLWRMRGGGRRGLLVIALINLLNLVLHAPINAALIRTVESPLSFVVGVVHVTASVAALAGAITAWRNRDAVSVLPRRLLAAGAVLTAAAVVVGGVSYATRTSDTPRPGDLSVATNGTQVNPQALEAEAGTVTVHVTNNDAVSPRSFDIDELDVHVILPPRTARRITFEAPSGRYVFYDQVTFTDATSGELTTR